ncbi:nephrin [Caerostris extrusa]|uniref:Nephrin n=1 Tax=Caerostris extrusa TaxID=172846 RepID=A0AAV4TJV1_CAEEX|nr:nephrin [Caerostris extrusa]
MNFVWSYNGGVIGDNFSSSKYASQAAQLDDVTWESVLFVKHLQANDFRLLHVRGKKRAGTRPRQGQAQEERIDLFVAIRKDSKNSFLTTYELNKSKTPKECTSLKSAYIDIRRPPDPPYNIRIVNTSSDSVVLSWTPGYSSGLPQQFRVGTRWWGPMTPSTRTSSPPTPPSSASPDSNPRKSTPSACPPETCWERVCTARRTPEPSRRVSRFYSHHP